MVQKRYPPPAGGAEDQDAEEQYDMLRIYGWRKRCLYLLVLLLLSIMVINFALTVWILKVTCLNTEGMGQLRITAGRVRLEGVSEFFFPLFAQEIHSQQETSLLIRAESHNVSVMCNDERGHLSGSLTLGSQSIETTGKHFEVISETGAMLFSAGREGVVVGAEKLTVTGSDGAECDRSMETPLVMAEASKDLRLEAPTRSLYMDAPKGVHINAVSGSTEAMSNMDISLLSLDGVLFLDAEWVRLTRLPLSGDREGTVPQERLLYEVCVCPDGKLYLSKAGTTSTCHEYSLEC